MKIKSLLLIGMVFFFVGEGLCDEGFKESDFYTKENFGTLAKTVLAINLSDDGIPYESILVEVIPKDSPVSHIVIDVMPTFYDESPVEKDNIRIAALACQVVGDGTRKAPWKSKYLKLVISEPGTNTRLDYLFLTSECRKYWKLLKQKERGSFVLYWMQIFGDSFKRAKANPNWIDED